LHDFTSLAIGDVLDIHHEAVDIGSDSLESLVDFVIYLCEELLRQLLALLGLDIDVNIVSDGGPYLPESLDVQFFRELFWDVILVINVLDLLSREDILVQTLDCLGLFFDDWVGAEVGDPLSESLLGQVIHLQSVRLIVFADLLCFLLDLLAN